MLGPQPSPVNVGWGFYDLRANCYTPWGRVGVGERRDPRVRSRGVRSAGVGAGAARAEAQKGGADVLISEQNPQSPCVPRVCWNKVTKVFAAPRNWYLVSRGFFVSSLCAC